MPHDPFTQPLFWQSAWRIAALLVLGLLGVVVAERRPLRVLRRSTILRRIQMWAWVAPVFLVSIFAGGFVLWVVVLYVVQQGLSEYARRTELERPYTFLLIFGALGGILVAVLRSSYVVFLPFAFFVAVTVLPVAARRASGSGRQVLLALFGFVYIGLPMAYAAEVYRGQPWGLEFVLVVGVAVSVSDTTASIAAGLVGSPRLAPQVSATKTWSAAAGNLVGAAIGVAVFWFAVPKAWTIAGVVVLMVLVGLGALWGDLTDGYIKRELATGSTGSLLVGFGGTLDRIDSLLMAVPIGYYGLLIANGIAR